MIGNWQDHWEQLQALQARLEEIAVGRAGGSIQARADLQSFFERSESLRDLIKIEVGGPKSNGTVDAAMRASTPLSIAHDITIKIKHGKQSQPPWSGDPNVDVINQSVAVSPETARGRAWIPTAGQPTPPPPPQQSPATSAHQWEVAYTPPRSSKTIIIDSLQLSRDIVAAWQRLLQSLRLI